MLRTGSVHTMLGGGGVSWWPDWDPSGTHYLVATDRSGGFNIQDISPNGFSRRMTEDPSVPIGLHCGAALGAGRHALHFRSVRRRRRGETAAVQRSRRRAHRHRELGPGSACPTPGLRIASGSRV